MSVAKQLYQLQEVDLELEVNERDLKQVTAQLGESQRVIETRNKAAAEQQRREELGRQQHSIEWEIDDLTTRISTAEEELYSGRIRNPKELTNLQHEIDLLKGKRGQLEDRALEIMGRVEDTSRNVDTLEKELKTLEAAWQSQQQQLSEQREQLKIKLADLRQKRQLMADKIDPQAVAIYQELKKQKGTPVAKVEQGICRGCRITLPITELQRTKSGELVRCSSCSRILFLA